MTAGPHPRPPLGLPAGSIRAIMALQIVITFWLLLLAPDGEHLIPIPLNLYFMLSLVMVFFVSHGRSIGQMGNANRASPLWLPPGSIRFFIIAGTVAVMAFLAFKHPERFDRLTPNPDNLKEAWKYYLGALVIGLVVGVIFRLFPFRHGWLYQSFQAWTAMIAMAILFLDLIFQAFINISLPKPIEAIPWGTALTGIVAFYYGSRS